MLRLFKAKLLVEKGLNCDCCVKVLSVEADTYAGNEVQARELVKQLDQFAFATVDIQLLEDNGVIEGVKNHGVIVVNSSEVYSGYHGNSPFRK